MDNSSGSFWEAAYRQNIAKMIGVCSRYTQDRQTAEDLAHDAFMVAINKVSSFENKGPFEAWLRRIVVNVALQHLREQKKLDKLGHYIEYHAFYNDFQEDSPGNEDLTFSEAELLEVISYLPEHHRLVFNLYVVDNFTHRQIAAELGISEGTSKSHLARARKKIRELLYDKLRENKERKRALLFFIFPYRLWNVDSLVGESLKSLSIQPQKNFRLNDADLKRAATVKYKPSGISKQVYLKVGILVMATAGILTGISKFDVEPYRENNVESYKENNEPFLIEIPDTVSGIISDLNAPISATISKNPIIVQKTKSLEPMKNLDTLGGLLMAGLALDTAGLSTDLPGRFKNREITINHILEPANSQEPKRMSGTFYASELFWSEVNNKLYLKGNHVKADITNNKFSGSGKFSFISHINYLVVNSTPMKLNETIKLADKKYHLIVLGEGEGFKKYGEKGKLGVVEISLAE